MYLIDLGQFIDLGNQTGGSTMYTVCSTELATMFNIKIWATIINFKSRNAPLSTVFPNARKKFI